VKGTFYWHDYETLGTDPARDRPVQFAGLRTDADLNVIGEPLVVYSRPSRDVLPHPEACLVTGISPQLALERGVCEAEFIERIHRELAAPGTCGVGYNSIRFDDEVTRFALYRNFYDPYAREFRNGNSRWDIIDMVRLTYALRPEGIEWPSRDDGLASFRLEDLTAANGIEHGAAHDALADVEATIAVARLIRERQPRLYHYVLEHRDKRSALAMLDLDVRKPVLHVSGMFGAGRHNIALIMPLCKHPSNTNEIICYDLAVDPDSLAGLDAEAFRERLFCPTDQLPEGVVRPGIKTVRVNRCPVLATPKLLDDGVAERLGIDVASCQAHRERLLAMGDLGGLLREVYSAGPPRVESNPDCMLYSGGFFSDADRRTMDAVRDARPEELGRASFPFEDERLPEMLFRYRARNYPESLTAEEREQWEEFRFAWLTDPEAGATICLGDYQAQLEELLASPTLTPERRRLLQDLLDYGDSLLA
jgi:exodeoxyribonuclease-1